MRIIIESTDKIVRLAASGEVGVQARIWEGVTDSGIKVHCYVTRIAHDEDVSDGSKYQFQQELKMTRKPSPEIQAIPSRLIL